MRLPAGTVVPPSLVAGCCRPQPQQQQHDLLEQALAEEMAKAQRRSGQDPAKLSQVQFKQVLTFNGLPPLIYRPLPLVDLEVGMTAVSVAFNFCPMLQLMLGIMQESALHHQCRFCTCTPT